MSKLLVLLTFCFILNAQIRPLDPPVAKESGMPFTVTGPDGSIYLSYVDYLGGEGHALRFSKWDGTQWTKPETIAQGKHWFINWADFGSIAVQADGTLLAHWLTRSTSGGKYGYGIRVSQRDPVQQTWREIYGMSLDEPNDYAGFLTFLPGAPAAIYLAPPRRAATARTNISDQDKDHNEEHSEQHRKTVRFVSFRPDGAPQDVEIDADACSCCQTAIAATSNGFLAAYRDHSAGEIRDISTVRFVDGAWTRPKTLHADGWKINGCPTDGPSIATSGKQAGITWMTRAGDQPKVQIALSADNGARFSKPIRLDDGNPLGRASLSMLDADNYLAVWIEKSKQEGMAEIRLRHISNDGKLSPSVLVAQVAVGRNTGFPKVAVSKDQILVAWRDGSVRTALLTKQQLLGSRP